MKRKLVVAIVAIIIGGTLGIYWPEWWHLGDSTYTVPVGDRKTASHSPQVSVLCKKCNCVSGYRIYRDGSSIWFPIGCCCPE